MCFVQDRIFCCRFVVFSFGLSPDSLCDKGTAKQREINRFLRISWEVILIFFFQLRLIITECLTFWRFNVFHFGSFFLRCEYQILCTQKQFYIICDVLRWPKISEGSFLKVMKTISNAGWIKIVRAPLSSSLKIKIFFFAIWTTITHKIDISLYPRRGCFVAENITIYIT